MIVAVRSPRWRPSSWCRSRRCAPRAGSAGCPRCCCPAGWSRCCSRSARRRPGAGAPARVIGLLVPRRWSWPALGRGRAARGHPLIDLKMMRLPAVWTTNLVALLFGVGMYAIFAFLPEFLQTPSLGRLRLRRQHHRVRADRCCRWRSRMFVVGMFAGRLATRLGAKAVVVAGCLHRRRRRWPCSPSRTTTSGRSTLAIVLLGVGFGLAFSAMSNLIVTAVPADADRRGQRHERQHPHHRRLDRRGRDGQHRHRAAAPRPGCRTSPATPPGSPAGGRARAGRAGRPADPGGDRARHASQRRAGACRTGTCSGRHRGRRSGRMGCPRPRPCGRPAATRCATGT